MIRKTFNKFAAQTFANKSKAHILPPKAINLHFPNAINPEFKFLNLTNVSSISFSVNPDRTEGKDDFLLSAKLSFGVNNHISNMDIAVFKSLEEANTALDDIRVALYMPKKSFAKWITIFAIICGLGCMATIHMKKLNMVNKQEVNTVAQVPNAAMPSTSQVGLPMMPPPGMNPGQIPPPVDNGEIDKMISQLQEIRNLQGGVPSQQGVPQQEQMQQPEEQQQEAPTNPADQFLNGLN